MFSNFAFNPEPKISITDNDSVKFINCYNKDGEPVGI